MEKIDFEYKNALARNAIEAICDYMLHMRNANYYNAARAIRYLLRVQDFSTDSNVRSYAIDALNDVHAIMDCTNYRYGGLEQAEIAIIEIYRHYTED